MTNSLRRVLSLILCLALTISMPLSSLAEEPTASPTTEAGATEGPADESELGGETDPSAEPRDGEEPEAEPTSTDVCAEPLAQEGIVTSGPSASVGDETDPSAEPTGGEEPEAEPTSTDVCAEPLVLEGVAASGSSANVGDEIKWTISAEGGISPYAYRFVIFKDGATYTDSGYGSSNQASLTATESGSYYAVGYVKDAEDSEESLQSATTTVEDVAPPAESLQGDAQIADETLAVTSLVAGSASANVGDAITWTATATGGQEPYIYMFRVYKVLESGDVQLYSRAYASGNTCSYTPVRPGTYKAYVCVRDARYDVTAELYSATIEATAPEIVISDVSVDKMTATVGETLTWTVTATGGYDLIYLYNIYKDGTQIAQIPFSSSATCEYATAGAGTYSVQVYVRSRLFGDSVSAGPTAESVVSIQTLSVTGLDADKAIANVGEAITWTASATGGLAPYTYMFKVYKVLETGDVQLYSRAYATDNTCSYTPVRPGTYKAYVCVRDARYDVTAELYSATIEVTAPEIVISDVSVDKATATVGETLTWTVTATGGYDLIYLYNIYKDGTQIAQIPFSSSATCEYATTSAGTYSVKVYVRSELFGDSVSAGPTAESAVSYSVLTVTGLDADKASANVGEAITWTASATGGLAPYTYMFKVYKVLETGDVQLYSRAYASDDTCSYTPVRPGTYKAYVFVRDARYDVTAELYSATIEATAPEIVISDVSVDKMTATVGETLTWTVTATGGYDLIYLYNIYKDGTQIAQIPFSSSATCEYAATGAGTYSVQVYVRSRLFGDSVSAGPTAESAVSIQTLSVTGLDADKASANVGDAITWTASATGGLAPYTYMFKVYKVLETGDVQLYSRAYASDNTCSYTPVRPGTYKAYVCARDARYDVTAELYSATIEATVPEIVISDVSVDKATATVGETLTWTVTATGGYDLIYLYNIYKDGTQIAQIPFSSSATCEYAATGAGTYSVKVYVRSELFGDSVSAGPTAESAVSYSALSVTSLVAGSASANVGDAITWTASATGGLAPYTYMFKVYKVLETGDVQLYSRAYASDNTCSYTPVRPGTYKAYVCVRDARYDVTAELYSATIEATAPEIVISDVSVDKLTATVGETLTWTVTATGGYDLIYLYNIYKDGTQIAQIPFSSSATCEYATAGAGTYSVKVYVRSELFGDSVSVGPTAESVVSYPALTVTSLEADKASAVTGETIKWTASVTGGLAPYGYWFEIYRGTDENAVLVFTQDYAAGNTCAYAPTEPGTYWARVYVGDQQSETPAQGDSSCIDVTASGSGEAFAIESLDGYLDTLYTQGDAEGYLGQFTVKNVSLNEGDDWNWDLEVVDFTGDAQPVELYFYTTDSDVADIHFRNPACAGTVTYRLSYSAQAGNYDGYYDIEIAVNAGEPEGLPEGIDYQPSSYQVAAGEEFTLLFDNIVFVGGAEGTEADWKHFQIEGDAREDAAKEDWIAEGVTLRYDADGRYTVRAMASVDNFTYTCEILIEVGGSVGADFGIYERKLGTTLYTGGETQGYYAFIWAEGVTLFGDESASWSIRRKDGEAGDPPVQLRVFDEHETYANIEFYDLTGAGTATYVLAYSAADGLYEAEIDIVITVEETAANLPTGISYTSGTRVVQAGGTLTFDIADIALTGGEIPEGTTAWYDFWMSDNVGSGCDVNQHDGIYDVTFNQPGRYVITAAGGVSNVQFSKTFAVIVENASGEQPEMYAYQRIDTLYADGNDDDFMIWALPRNFSWDDNTELNWTLTRIDENGGNPVNLMILERGQYGLVYYTIGDDAGTAAYRLTLTTDGGLYSASKEFSVTVYPTTPDNLPTGIIVPGTEYTIGVNEVLTFYWADFGFAEGEVPEGGNDWKEYWLGDGNWENAEVNDSDTQFTMCFSAPGRYIFSAVIGIGNYWVSQKILVTVTGEPEFTMNQYQRTETLFADAGESNNLGAVDVDGIALMDDDDWAWTIERIDENGGDPVDLYLEDENPWHASVNYRLGEGTGTVTYRVSYAAADGYYAGYCDFTVTVLDAVPGDFPTGISVPATEYTIDPGEELAFNWSDINFAEGDVPEGCEVWRDFWWSDGNWDQCEVNDDGETYTLRFSESGRYTIEAVIGIGNYQFTQKILITVSGESNLWLDPYQRTETLFADANQANNLGVVNVNNIALLNDDDWSWTIERIDENGGNPVELLLVEESPWGVCVNYQLGEGTGTVTYRVSYTAADGYYAGYCDFTVTVLDTVPGDFPTEISVPATEYTIDPGEELAFSWSDINFAEGDVPEGYEVWRDFWWNDGNWDQCEVNDDGETYTLRFSEPGRYTLEAVIGIGNYQLTQKILITVRGESNFRMDKYARFEDLYFDGIQDFNLGWIELVNVSLLEDDDWSWTLECIEGDPGDALTVSLSDEKPTIASINYVLSGDAPAEDVACVYRVSYSAADGYYSGSVDYAIVLHSGLAEDFPTGCTVPVTEFEIDPGETLTLHTSDISFVEGETPAGASVWRNYWTDDWGDACEYGGDDANPTYTFSKPGRYALSAIIGIGNDWFGQQMVITVRGETEFSLSPYLRFDTLYVGGWEEHNLGAVDVYGATVLESDDWSWSIQRVDENGGDPIELYFDNETANRVSVNFRLTGEAGAATFRVSYTAVDGYYDGSAEFTVTVLDSIPEDFPTGISVPATAYTVDLGEELTLTRSDINFAEGAAPEGCEVWRDLWTIDGNWDNCEKNDDAQTYTYRFSAPGRYTLDAVIGIGNDQFVQRILITVRGETDFQLNQYQRTGTLFADANESNNLGALNVNSITLLDDDVWSWSIERIDENGGDPVELYLEGEDCWGVRVNYRLGEGTGTVTYRVSYSAADGYYAGYRDFTVTVLESVPGDFPTGISVPATTYTIDPGEELALRWSDIGFAEGDAPEGYEVWRDFWWNDGNWDSSESKDDGETYALRFSEPGRYTLEAVIGIGNLWYSQLILITVSGEADFTMNQFQRFYTLYADANGYDCIGSVDVGGAAILDNDDWAWTIERIDENGGAPVIMTLGDESRSHVSLFDELTGETGTATFRVSFSAVDGYYVGSCEFTVEVVSAAPADVPTALALPATSYAIGVGEVLALNRSDIGYADGVVPEGCEFWRDYWYDVGDWSNCTYTDDGDQCGYSFDAPGRYTLSAVLGINNYVLKERILITVGDAAEASLSQYVRFEDLYVGGEGNFNIGALNVDNLVLLENEDWSWNVECVSGNEDGTLTVSLSDERENHVGINYALSGTAPAEATTYVYRVTYTAAGGYYSGYRDFTMTVHPAVPEDLPSGAAVPATEYTVGVGETLTLCRGDISFAEGEAPAGATVWREYWPGVGDWSACEFGGDDSNNTYTFSQPGRYSVNAMIGIGNNWFSRQILITVSGDAEYALSQNMKFDTLYADADPGNYLGSVDTENVSLYEGDDWTWSIERIDENGADPVRLTLDDQDGSRTSVFYELGSGVGTVTYRVSYSAAGGYYAAYTDITVTVEASALEDFPTGILVPATQYRIAVGETLILSRDDVSFAAGDVPEGYEAWADFWCAGGNWDNCDQLDENGQLRMTFGASGRYILEVAVGIGNYMATQYVQIEVIGDSNLWLETSFRFDTLYQNVRQSESLGWMRANNLGLLPDDDWAWSVERVDGYESCPVALSISGDSRDFTTIDYELSGDTLSEATTYTFRVTYSAADGYYYGTYDIEITVYPSVPDDFPTDILLHESQHFAGVGEALTITTDVIGFAVGEAPEGVTVWRDYEIGEGNWDACDWGVDGNAYTYTFSEPGIYYLYACIGIGNDYFRQQVMIVVDE